MVGEEKAIDLLVEWSKLRTEGTRKSCAAANKPKNNNEKSFEGSEAGRGGARRDVARWEKSAHARAQSHSGGKGADGGVGIVKRTNKSYCREGRSGVNINGKMAGSYCSGC
jgi:hypothetical protein